MFAIWVELSFLNWASCSEEAVCIYMCFFIFSLFRLTKTSVWPPERLLQCPVHRGGSGDTFLLSGEGLKGLLLLIGIPKNL